MVTRRRGTKANSNVKIAEMGEYFKNLFERNDQDADWDCYEDYDTFVGDTETDIAMLTVDDIEVLVNKASNGKCPGPDLITNELLKIGGK